MPLSSRGLGHFPFTEKTGIRFPLGVLLIYFAGIAQLVERGPSKSNVACSNHVARFVLFLYPKVKKVNFAKKSTPPFDGITLVSWRDL